MAEGRETERRDRRIPIMMTDAELAAIDDWMFANRVRTRAGAIRRLCAASLGQARWQTIETAPKDGSSILAYVEGDDGRPLRFVAHWSSLDPKFLVGGAPPIDYQDDPTCEWLLLPLCRVKQPTHWMPLPAAPQEGSRD